MLHDDEVTYSVVLSRAHLRPFSKRVIHRFIADILVDVVGTLGVPATCTSTRTGSLHNPNCFETSGAYEISTLDGSKLVGSAQLITRTASLQHGSVPLSGRYRRISRYLRTGGGPSLPGVP